MTRCIYLLLLSFLIGCNTAPSSEERRHIAERLAALNGWHAIELSTINFNLISYVPDRRTVPDRVLTVYIEGDGLAWNTPYIPSSDPTPGDPVALRLALKHPKGNVAYLARPCQYQKSHKDNCQQRYWTGSRYAQEVISSESQALDQLKERFNAKKLNLVGYSGGGTVSVLLAARRHDVDRLITVAGNLDHQAWTSMHKITPLEGSLNPLEYIDKLKHIRQWHFTGANDKVIPPVLSRSFANRFPVGNTPAVIVLPSYDHRCCWAERWESLWGVTNSH